MRIRQVVLYYLSELGGLNHKQKRAETAALWDTKTEVKAIRCSPLPGIKHGLEEMEREFPLGIFRPEKQDYLYRCSVALGNVPLEQPKKACSIYFPTGFSGNFL